MGSSGRRRQLRLRAHVYGKFSNSIPYDHQLILRHVSALDYCLQVQQRLQSCLFTSIKWILCKFRLLRDDQVLDIIFQLVYAYAGLRSTIDFPPRRLLVGRVWLDRRSRLRCCTMRDATRTLETPLATRRRRVTRERCLRCRGASGTAAGPAPHPGVVVHWVPDMEAVPAAGVGMAWRSEAWECPGWGRPPGHEGAVAGPGSWSGARQKQHCAPPSRRSQSAGPARVGRRAWSR